MTRPRLGTLFALAACLIIAYPSSAFSIPDIGTKDNGWSIADETYLHVYKDCWAALSDACGRNIVDDGLANGGPPSTAQVERSTETMRRWLAPPEPEPVAAVSSDGVAPAPTTSSVPAAPVSSGGCPSYMAAEADSPSDVNPTSGAAGCYQILPSTAAANGCSDVGPDCAARICASQGPSAWAASGANPCPYVQP